MKEIEEAASVLQRGVIKFELVRQTDEFNSCNPENVRTFGIRVGFGDGALLGEAQDRTSFFSAIGTNSRYSVNKQMASMNLPFALTSTKDFRTSNILHEFCHAIGCLHEHSR